MELEDRFTRFISDYDESSHTKGLELYEDMPELYEAFFGQHNDYNHHIELIREYTELDSDSTIVEGACGVGHMLRLLDDENYNTYGFDAEPEMLRIAAENTDATLFRSELTNFFIPEPIDCFIALGNPLFHLDAEERQLFFEQVYDNLSNRSTVIFGYSDKNDTVDGGSSASVYELANWKIRRNMITVDVSDEQIRESHSYRVTDTNRDLTKLQVGFSTHGHSHNTQEIQEELENLGFTNITVMKPDELDEAVVIARKVS